MRTFSATCHAITIALRNNTLNVYEREGRFGRHAVIADDKGVIEVADDMIAALDRVSALKGGVSRGCDE